MNSWHNKLFNDLFWQSWPSIIPWWELGAQFSPVCSESAANLTKPWSIKSSPSCRNAIMHDFQSQKWKPYSDYCQQQKHMVLHWCSPLRLSLPTFSLQYKRSSCGCLAPLSYGSGAWRRGEIFLFVLVYSQAVNNNICSHTWIRKIKSHMQKFGSPIKPIKYFLCI